MSKIVTTKDVKRILKTKFPSVKLLNDYAGWDKKLSLYCKSHKHKYYSLLSNIRASKYCCPSLGYSNVNSHKTYDTKRYKKALKETGLTHITPLEASKAGCDKIKQNCKYHGDFISTPGTVLRYGYGCSKCKIQAYLSRVKEKEIVKHDEALSSKYEGQIVRVGKYIKWNEPIKYKCKTHGIFERSPHDVVYSSAGCYGCSVVRYSKIAIDWLKTIEKKEGIKIRHAEHIGEFRIPGTHYKADGFHKKSNTVYEFHGDCYHGNPKLYKPHSKPNPYLPELTAKQLYTKTKAKEEKLKSLGYKVVSIWEADYRRQFIG